MTSSTTTSNNTDDFIAPTCHSEIEVLFADEDILLINKPSGLLSLSGKNPANIDSVHHRLVNGRVKYKEDGNKTPSLELARLLHRLDFGTSGLMLIALNKAANSALTKQFQSRQINKRYIAMLDGHITADCGEICLPIAKDKTHFPLVTINIGAGKHGHSRFTVLERISNPERTRVEFEPATGRTHQLRVHSLAIGHPILGCDLYKNDCSKELATRLLLHANALDFNHPRTGERIYGRCPCPF